jgi:hypothetical protein
MPPKQNNSKKEVKKAQARVIEDKTFGLKNKNKSKVINFAFGDANFWVIGRNICNVCTMMKMSFHSTKLLATLTFRSDSPQVVQSFVQQVTQQAKQAGMSKEERERQEKLQREKAMKKEAKVEVDHMSLYRR